jgi:KDO2-lipid IV(A) lauroyltransferase
MAESVDSTPTRRAAATDAVTEWAFATGWSVVKRLPPRLAYRTFDVAADALWRRRGGDVVQLERNLARVHPEMGPTGLRDLSRQSMRSYFRYWCDAFRLPTWSPERVNRTCGLDHIDRIDSAVLAGTGAIMVSNHAGNWDHVGAWGCLRYGGITTVAERLKPEGLFQMFVDYRESLGMDVIGTGDPEVMRKMVRAVEANRVVPLLGDRDIGRKGVVVDFFGEPASFPAGPAVLALLTGAPLFPMCLWYEPWGASGCVYEAVEVPADGSRAEKVQSMVQQVATAFEAGIREHSIDWHMMQPVWLADLDPGRLAERERP